MRTLDTWILWGYPPWLDAYAFIIGFGLLSIAIALVIAPAYRLWADRRNRPSEEAEVSLRVEPPSSDVQRPQIRSGYVSVFFLALGAIFVFVKGSPPIRVFLVVSIVGGAAITLLIRYLAGHRPSISLQQPADMTEENRNTTLEQIDHDSLR